MLNRTNSYKNIVRVALPIMVSGVAQNVVNVTDTAFLGNLSEIALGAAGNAGIFYFVLVVSGVGFTTGSQIIIGRRNGEQNYGQIGKVFDHTLYFIMPLALILFIFLKFLSPAFLALITESDQILESANLFLSYRSYGVFFAFLNFTFNAFYVGTTQTKVLIWGTLVMMVTNVFLDYVLIFGNWGFPQLGIEGAAIASTIAEGASFLFALSYTYFTVDLKKYNLFTFHRFDSKVFARIFKVGSPIMLQNFLSLSAWFIFFMIIEKIGETELAISHIVRSIYMVLMIPLFGYSAATNTLVSNLIGQGKPNQVLPLLRKMMLLSVGTTAVVLLFNIVLPEYIIEIYTKDKALIANTLDTLFVINFSMFFFSVAFILFNGVTGTGNTRTSLLIEFITIIIYLVAAYCIALVWQSSLPVVWCSEFIYFSLLGILSLIYLKFGNWKNVVV